MTTTNRHSASFNDHISQDSFVLVEDADQNRCVNSEWQGEDTTAAIARCLTGTRCHSYRSLDTIMGLPPGSSGRTILLGRALLRGVVIDLPRGELSPLISAQLTFVGATIMSD